MADEGAVQGQGYTVSLRPLQTQLQPPYPSIFTLTWYFFSSSPPSPPPPSHLVLQLPPTHTRPPPLTWNFFSSSPSWANSTSAAV